MKEITISISIAILLILVAIFIPKPKLTYNNSNNKEQANNVTVVNGVQVVEINVKGGYGPRKSVAKANIPTIIRFKTNNTFDCSSSVRIPSLNIFKMLPQTGNTDIDIGNQNIGKLNGSCGMGMYQFEIEFK